MILINLKVVNKPLEILLLVFFTTTFLCFGGCSENNNEKPCTKKIEREAISSDEIYVAKIQKLTCVSGAEISYEIVISTQKSEERPWILTISVENDFRNEVAPIVRWEDRRTLIVETKTRTLSGSLKEHIGKDLILERVFLPSDPAAFPNYF